MAWQTLRRMVRNAAGLGLRRSASSPVGGHPLPAVLLLSTFLIGWAADPLVTSPPRAFPTRADLGDPAPDFDLVDLDGVRHSLYGERGSVVLLYFFGNNAPACREPARLINDDLRANYGSKGLRVLGIDCWDGPWQAVDEFRQQTGIDYPLLLLGRSTATAYDLSYNSFVIVDTRGVVRYLSAGPEDGAFDLGALRTTIERLLQESNQTKEATWGAIKSLFGPRKHRPVV